MSGTRPDGDELNTGLLLFIPYRSLETRVLRAVADAGFADITLAQARVLQRVRPGGSRLTELAAAAQVTKQTAGFLVDQLAAAGYVRRRPDPRDGRARLVEVAERGWPPRRWGRRWPRRSRRSGARTWVRSSWTRCAPPCCGCAR